MEMNHETRLTSAEMASLWLQYVKDTAKLCVLKYFSAKVEDRDFRTVIEFGVRSTEEYLTSLTDLFERENFPIPTGFSNKDVNTNAPRLFSDLYFIYNLKDMTVAQMSADALAIGLGSRYDIVAFHEKLLNDAVQLQVMIKEVLLKKGVYVRPPYISLPDQAEFVTNQNFLGNLMGKQRPLTVIEISHLFLTNETNFVAKETLLGFAQVAKSEKVKNYFIRGKEIANKQMKILKQVLTQDDLPAPMLWDSAVTNSKVSPFSDKLMMFLITAMAAGGIAKYGAAMGSSPRKDVALKYGRLLVEISLYAEDGANIMIEKGWFEEPPHSPDHNRLIRE
ncbi:DUF3231 family protein [Alkalihalobacillus sp. AL-G]|uniref:DUF3231 family protein n=1 Tax=Alkalihalobacillus sp. AL-G TaxID=2926399 RepID=UPI00272B0654|nr:DUF3231 family protein [Alkalihalobacillus sp. AL-G]WLD94681.1 DUF3231 family protein [Alkalihalobacillus sp. AL-G]